jgi:hypothetical protein
MDYYDEEKFFLSSQKTAHNDKLFLYLNCKEEGAACDTTTVNEFLKHSYKLSIVENRLQYKDEAGEVHVLNATKGITEGGEWLSSKLPLPPFDVFQDDNLRKSEEAQSLYTAINIKSIVDDENYTAEFDGVYKDYDFSKMKNANGLSFTSLVIDWSKENSFLIKIMISASKYVLVEHKKDEQSFINSLLPKDEATGITDLKAKLKSISYKYTKSGGDLSNERVKTLSKIELLTSIAECNREKDLAIGKSDYGLLFKITKLNAEYLSISNRKGLKLSAVKSITKQCKSLKLDDDKLQTLIGKCRKRLLKAAVHSLHKVEILKYLSDKLAYELPPKA